MYFLMTADASDERRRSFDEQAGLVETPVDEWGRPIPAWVRNSSQGVDPAVWAAQL